MLVVGLFFIALRSGDTGNTSITIPGLGVALSKSAVLAAGGTILSFLAVATFGSFRAWQHALQQCEGDEWETAADRLDLHPTAFDLAYFTIRENTPFLERVFYVAFYPGYLALIVGEAAWLQWWLWTNEAPFKSVFLVAGTPTLAWAVYHTFRFWFGRIRRVYKQFRRWLTVSWS